MNIVKALKSFDIFNSDTVRFLKQKALNIFMIETGSDNVGSVSVSSDNNSININVINRPKTYNLLVSAKKRLDEKKLQEKRAVKL